MARVAVRESVTLAGQAERARAVAAVRAPAQLSQLLSAVAGHACSPAIT